MTSSSPSRSWSSDACRGALLGPLWTATARTPRRSEERRHEVGVGRRTRRTPAFAAPRRSRHSSSAACARSASATACCERLGIEAPVPPRNRLEVDRVRNAPVAERHELLAPNSFDQTALVDEVVAAQREQIGAVHPVRRRREPEQELRREVIDHPPIRRRGRVMEFVDDDVVERVRRELVQPAGERLDTGEDEPRVGLFSPPKYRPRSLSGCTCRNTSRLCRRISSRCAMNSTRPNCGRAESKAASHVLPRPVAITTSPAR